MTAAEHWTRIKEIVGEALERNPGERAAFLHQVCLPDDPFRSEIESLVAAYSKADGFSVQTWGAALSDTVAVSSRIGPYRLERELGAGGMGQVWLAEQTEPVQRWVALKLIRAGFYDSTVAERFLLERQSLASMNHPAIAKVFEAGTTAAGQQYFAMEYVDGAPITAYCDEKRLGVRERLRLFLQVCEGVRHAHQKAIIHRDLKPSNILVVEVDGTPAPRIIDFGLAKSAAPAMAGQTLLTQVGCLLGTPGYMSPEQTDPSVEDVDTRTDVYSLGIVLYELLTGFLPFDTQNWKKQPLDEVLKQMRESDPPRPSTRVSTSKTTSETRGMQPGQLAKLLRGELDWITLKALERDRDRRYGSPSELAADIERYLTNRTITARPVSPAYRLRKYIRRNRVMVAVAAGALALIIAFADTQSVQLRRIKRERDRADRITKFMTGMFKVSDPNQGRGNSVTAREILDQGSEQIKTELASDPETQAELMQVMGRVYTTLGLSSRARPLLERSVELRRRILGPKDPKTLVSMDDLASLLDYEGHPAEAATMQEESLKMRRLVQGPDHPDVRKSMGNLAIYFLDEGRLSDAEKLDRETLATSVRVLGPDHADTLTTMNNLAADLIKEGRPEEAKTLLSQALTKERSSPGLNHPLTLATMNNLADVLIHTGQYTEAEKLQQETLAIQRKVLGPNHPDTAGSMYNLAVLAELQGNRDKALTLLRESLDHGMGPAEAIGMKNDEDLKTMRDDERFQVLIVEAQKRNAGAAKK